MAKQVRNIAKEFSDRPKLDVVTLYAAKPVEQQQQVFKKTGDNNRKLVLATNIAETSVTIPGVKHVIDSCRVKTKVNIAFPYNQLLCKYLFRCINLELDWIC